MTKYGLVADVGGTNVRFGLVDLGTPGNRTLLAPRKLVSRDYPTIIDAMTAYLSAVKPEAPISAAVLDVAGPVHNDEIVLTNLGWHFAARDLRGVLHTDRIHLINDYEAIAYAVPHLDASDLMNIGSTMPVPSNTQAWGTVAIVGPGTGLGVAGCIRTPSGVVPLVTEGGHVDFAPFDEVETEILSFLRRRFDHVSAERVLSGPGLVNLHEALSLVKGVAYEPLESHQITERARQAPASLCGEVFGRFCAIMGSVCGNVALVMGAREGVLIAGGILPAMAETFAASTFRERFEAKGRFSNYMKAIPTRLIVQPYAGLVGAASVLTARTQALSRRVNT
jgi:glucokinase